jgi:hypothetical protein
MTNSMMDLRALVEQAPDSDILRDMIGPSASSGEPLLPSG